MHNDLIRRIINAYDAPIVRVYCLIRFAILRQRFLTEIGAHLPESGSILDIGCGFGLFSLFFAATCPGRTVDGLDLSRRRTAIARRAASRLGMTNVHYRRGDARCLEADRRYDAVYMLDIIHHIPAEEVPVLLRRLRESLATGAVLVVKDIDASSVLKTWFTWLLDKLMAPLTPVRYWSVAELTRELEAAGFEVESRALPDILPYPHALYVCRAVESRAS